VRSIWLVAGAIALAAGVPGRNLAAEDDVSARLGRGGGLVEKTCVACHATAQLDALVARRVARTSAESALDGFLKGHHVPDAGQRADVVAYLRARLEAAPKSP